MEARIDDSLREAPLFYGTFIVMTALAALLDRYAADQPHAGLDLRAARRVVGKALDDLAQ